MSVAFRLNRLFAPDGKCFDLALDHGAFGEYSFLAGIEDIKNSVDVLVKANPDAIQLSVGQAPILQVIPGKTKPALVLRADISNAYGAPLPRYLFNQLIANPVEQALRLDATCVVANLLMLPNQPEVHRQCVENITRLKGECERYAMPLMVEPLAMQDNPKSGGYMVDGTLSKIVTLVRQAIELGADVLKADPCDDPAEYHKVIQVAGGRPVLVRGGGRVSDQEILERTAEMMRQGAKGIVYGRNVIQHANPHGMTRALMSIVHDDATPHAAMQYITAKEG